MTTRPTMNDLMREAAGRRDPELAQQPVERGYGNIGVIGGGRGGTGSGWPVRRDPGDLLNEQLRLALAVKRGLIQASDVIP
jgi:hypothetical protein